MLGAICGSARFMGLAAQSMDPYFAQESMDFAYDSNIFTIVIPCWRRHIHGPIGNLY